MTVKLKLIHGQPQAVERPFVFLSFFFPLSFESVQPAGGHHQSAKMVWCLTMVVMTSMKD